MASHQTDMDGFKLNLFLLPYAPLEPMVINFTFHRADSPCIHYLYICKGMKHGIQLA